MRPAGSWFSQHPRQVIAVAVALILTTWGVSLYSIASQIGRPFRGFLYTPDSVK